MSPAVRAALNSWRCLLAPLSTSMRYRGCLAEWARAQQKIAIPGHGCPGPAMAESPERDLCHKDTRQDNALAVEVADDPDCVPSDQCPRDDARGRDTAPDRLFRRGGAQAVPAVRRGRARRHRDHPGRPAAPRGPVRPVVVLPLSGGGQGLPGLGGPHVRPRRGRHPHHPAPEHRAGAGRRAAGGGPARIPRLQPRAGPPDRQRGREAGLAAGPAVRRRAGRGRLARPDPRGDPGRGRRPARRQRAAGGRAARHAAGHPGLPAPGGAVLAQR